MLRVEYRTDSLSPPALFNKAATALIPTKLSNRRNGKRRSIDFRSEECMEF
jgi:hypothetical protein